MSSEKTTSRLQAIKLRKRGLSLRAIEQKLQIPRSTLSGWLKDIKLSDKQLAKLQEDLEKGLKRAREKAAETHRLSKQLRIDVVRDNVEQDLTHPIFTDLKSLELALAMLYLGEGGKTRPELRLGNSNPIVLRFYLAAIERLYNVPRNSFRFELHLRVDQDEKYLKKFWAKQLSVPFRCISYVIKDIRTAGKPTRPGYYGVCAIYGGPVAIQRRLMYLSEAFCIRICK